MLRVRAVNLRHGIDVIPDLLKSHQGLRIRRDMPLILSQQEEKDNVTTRDGAGVRNNHRDLQRGQGTHSICADRRGDEIVQMWGRKRLGRCWRGVRVLGPTQPHLELGGERDYLT